MTSPAEFVASVHKSLDHEIADDQRTARSRLEMETWQQKAKDFERVLLGE